MNAAPPILVPALPLTTDRPDSVPYRSVLFSLLSANQRLPLRGDLVRGLQGILPALHTETNRVQVFARGQMSRDQTESQPMPVLPIHEVSLSGNVKGLQILSQESA